MAREPYPEADRRHRHRRGRPAGGRQSPPRRGPSEKAIADALEAVAEHSIPGTPPVGAALILSELPPRDRTTDNGRRVKAVSITAGDPRHGAHRSDDYIGKYRVVAPLDQIDGTPDGCPECDSHAGRYEYGANHYIAGYEAVSCARCGYEIQSEFWD